MVSGKAGRWVGLSVVAVALLSAGAYFLEYGGIAQMMHHGMGRYDPSQHHMGQHHMGQNQMGRHLGWPHDWPSYQKMM